MKKILIFAVLPILLTSLAIASATKSSPFLGMSHPCPNPFIEIIIEDSWDLPSDAGNSWYGVGCKNVGGTVTLWCVDYVNLIGYEFDETGVLTGSQFTLEPDTCDPDDHCYIDSDADIGADDSLMIGDYATYGTNLLDIWDNISSSPVHRDWSVTATKVMGVSYSPDHNVLYFDDNYDALIWGDLTSTTFTEQGGSADDGMNVSGVAYIPAEAKSHPPLLVVVSQDLWLSILELDETTGYPTGNYFASWLMFPLPAEFETPGGAEWDGQYLWVVDQKSSNIDKMYKLALKGLSYDVNIQPTSLGNIKAMFK